MLSVINWVNKTSFEGQGFVHIILLYKVNKTRYISVFKAFDNKHVIYEEPPKYSPKRSLAMLVTNSLTHGFTHSVAFSRLDGCE